MKKLQVICFYWEGDRWQSNVEQYSSSDLAYTRNLKKVGNSNLKLVSRYVNNLFDGVTKYADRDFDFICFTNEKLNLKKGIETRSFPMITKRGVLPRLFMFSEQSGLFGHQVLCLDLDVVVVGSLEPLMAYSGLFCARPKFQQGGENKLDGDIMSFRAGPEAEARFWTPFVKDVKGSERLTQGRERYWMRHVAGDIADLWTVEAPKAVLSYKRNLKGQRPPKTAAIVSYHGYPRPHQVKDNWTKKYWK